MMFSTINSFVIRPRVKIADSGNLFRDWLKMDVKERNRLQAYAEPSTIENEVCRLLLHKTKFG
jgi:hypothetical protein